MTKAKAKIEIDDDNKQELVNQILRLETKLDIEKFFKEVRDHMFKQNQTLLSIENKIAIHNNYEKRFEKAEKKLSFHDKALWMALGAIALIEFLSKYFTK